jgi:hypothetical protein
MLLCVTDTWWLLAEPIFLVLFCGGHTPAIIHFDIIQRFLGNWCSSLRVGVRLWAGRPGFNSLQGP